MLWKNAARDWNSKRKRPTSDDQRLRCRRRRLINVDIYPSASQSHYFMGFFYHCCCLVEISYGLFSFWKLQLLPLTVKQSVTLARHVFICFPYNTVQCKCVSQSLHFSCGNDRVGFNFWNHKCYRSIGKCIERRARMIADGMNTTVAAMKLQHETGKMEKNNLQVRINKRGERGE